jgi:hypothetical protein
MKKLSLITLTLVSFSAVSDVREEPSYVEGDGGLSLQCEGSTKGSAQQNIFQLTALFDENSPRQGFDMISDENLASGNGDIVYQVSIAQTPHDGSEIISESEVIPGCELAPLQVTMNEEQTETHIYFECDADGDAGYGNIKIDMEDEELVNPIGRGQIFFPEGQRDISSPFPEDTVLDISCNFAL